MRQDLRTPLAVFIKEAALTLVPPELVSNAGCHTSFSLTRTPPPRCRQAWVRQVRQPRQHTQGLSKRSASGRSGPSRRPCCQQNISRLVILLPPESRVAAVSAFRQTNKCGKCAACDSLFHRAHNIASWGFRAVGFEGLGVGHFKSGLQTCRRL